jgi:hypothetical protein
MSQYYARYPCAGGMYHIALSEGGSALQIFVSSSFVDNIVDH